ncbi:MAG TPA: alpha/beta hydrolase [Saprospiraceae bacterium]|nr:alpha/beta hydrolase [Saprospiraceae bacterium]
MIEQVMHTPHFFIYNTSKNGTEPNACLYGEMVIEGKNLIKRQSWQIYGDFAEELRKTVEQQTSHNNGILIYIHGYQADNAFFMQRSGYVIQRKIIDKIYPHYAIALSLQWCSVIPYGKAVDSALNKGRNFAPVVMDIVQIIRQRNPDAPISFICHSMGNRVFQGLYEACMHINHNPRFKDVFLMAADLESNIFESAFNKIEAHTASLQVYHNRQDVTLKIADAMVKNPRLGISGTLDYYKPQNCTVHDITDVDDDYSFGGKYTHHRYFYGSATIRNAIIQKLSCQ